MSNLMEKLFKLLNLPADKANHAFWLTFAFTLMVSTGIYNLVALVGVALVALSKEVYDYFHKNHTADVWDWVAGVLPAGILTLFQMIL